MAEKVAREQVQTARLRAQRLYWRDECAAPGLILSKVFALQAQDAVAAGRSLWARCTRLTAADVTEAIARERSIVRTWCMRGTLHLLPAADVARLLRLFGPTFVRRAGRRRAQLGLTDEHSQRAAALMRRYLAGARALTRHELAEQLSAHEIPTAGQAMPHLLSRAALEGLICCGPERDGDPTYVLLAEWLGLSETSAGPDPYARLARRYLDAFGPAAIDDLISWSGLSASAVRAGFEQVRPELLALELDGRLLWLPESRADRLARNDRDDLDVRLLPAYDGFLLGYRDRALTVPEEFARRVHPGGGLIRATLLVNGRAAGTWKAASDRAGGLRIAVEPFTGLAPEVCAAVEDEARSLGRFHGVDAHLDILRPIADR